MPSNDAIEDFRHDLEEVSTSVEFVQGNGVTDLRDTDYESADVSYDTPRYNIDDGFAKKRRKRQVSQAKVKQIIQSHLIPGFVSTRYRKKSILKSPTIKTHDSYCPLLCKQK